MDSQITELFVQCSIKELRHMYSQIESCLGRIKDDQIWSRGASHENSIGNLILHLCGNVRQWIGSGVGGEHDARDRDSEFQRQGGVSGSDLLKQLDATVSHASEIIGRITPEQLLKRIEPQGYHVTVLEAVYHVISHFHQHAGQIIFATKILTGEDLGLYRPLKQTK